MARKRPELEELLQMGYRYALSLTHEPARAEDLVQDACASVLAAEAPMSKAYLFATIRNRFIDQYRRKKRFPHASYEDVGMFVEGKGEVDPAQQAEKDWGWGQVDGWSGQGEGGGDPELAAALGQLRDVEREALFLHVVLGHTAQQIAVATQSPRGSVLSLIHRSKTKLRRILREREAKL